MTIYDLRLRYGRRTPRLIRPVEVSTPKRFLQVADRYAKDLFYTRVKHPAATLAPNGDALIGQIRIPREAVLEYAVQVVEQ